MYKYIYIYIHRSTDVIIGGLEELDHDEELPDITCTPVYYQSDAVTVTWELVGRNGDVTTLPGYMTSAHRHSRRRGIKCMSALNYTLSTDDVQSILRCIVRVYDENFEAYEAKNEVRIPSYGRCINKVPEINMEYR